MKKSVILPQNETNSHFIYGRRRTPNTAVTTPKVCQAPASGKIKENDQKCIKSQTPKTG